LRLQVPRSTYETWVRDTVCLAYEDGTYVIGAANAYAQEWLSLRMRSMVKQTLASITGHAVDVTFVVQSAHLAEEPEAPAAPLLELAPEGDGARQPGGWAPRPEDAPVSQAVLDPRHTFEAFIVGPSNRMAHAVAMSVGERPGSAYNPLFLYGGSGLGKTHLLQAIGHAAQQMGKRVLYVTAEFFTNELISNIRTQSTDSFRSKYRNMDLLLLDDIQFLTGKEQTQEEFFHTFNALHSAGRQIVMTSDRPPQAIQNLEDRLRSRFGWGMIADVQPPNLETRIAILQTKAAGLGRRVPEDVFHLIAQRAQRNIRDLEGALTQVLARADLFQRPLTAALADEALAYLAPLHSKPGLDDILEAAATFFGTPAEELTGRSRAARIALQRQMLMYVMREETGASLPQIGQALGGRDHTTVLYGYEKIAADLESDGEMSRTVNALRNRIYEPVPRRLNP
jgi:chromosomal replication initiator protein